jgi:phage-related minor tail protein
VRTIANNIKGITVEINGETGPLDKALKGVNSTSRDLQKELREVEKGLKLDPGNTVLLAQKQEILAKSITNTKEKLGALKTAEEQAQAKFAEGEISEQQYRALQREVINTEQSLERLETQAIQSNAVLSSDQATGNLKHMAVAAGAAAVAVGAAFVGMGVAAMDNADELQRQADVTGFSAERLQELQYAGNNLGVELDVLTGAQAKLIKSMDAAKGGTGAQADAFKELGISVLDGNGHLKDAKDVMGEAFTALGKVGNETERDALSMKIFGKSAMEMNPMIKAGGEELNKLTNEAKNNGAVMSNEAVSGLDTFGDTLDNIKNSVLGSVGEALAGMMPKLQAILEKMMQLPQWIQKNSTMLEIIGVGIATVTALVIAFNIQQALMASGLTLWGAIAGVGTTITTGLGVAFAFLTSPIALIIIAIGLLVAGFIYLWNNCEGFRTFWIGLWEGIKTTTKIVVDALVNFFTVTIPAGWNSLVAFFTGIPAWFSGLWTGVQTTTTTIWNKIGSFFY